jgi:hypothetical protein
VGIDKRYFADIAARRLVPWSPLTMVWISGVEVTQSIQYYQADQHLTDPSDRGPDNSVRHVANKAAWVRVYAASFYGASVTATLEIERRDFGFLWFPVTTLTPQGASPISATLSDTYVTQRTTLGRTLNFVIPAAQFTGVLRLTVRLTSPDGATVHDTQQTIVDASLRQTLRLRSILVNYNGPNTANPPAGTTAPTITLAAPTLADAAVAAGRALLMMPVQSTGVFTSAGTLNWSLPLDDPRTGAGGCSNNWNSLLAWLGLLRTNDGNRPDVVYYGLLPAGIPIGVPGCGVGGLGAGRSNDPGTLVHEIGHGYDFQHTPCGAAGTTDPNYPTYQPYPSASIGEYGFNISNGQIFSPASTFDYMSYCFPQWMSLYQHNRLINHPRLDPQFVGDTPIWVDKLEYREYSVVRDLPYPPDPWKEVDKRMNPVIAITGIVHSPREIEVQSVARVEAAGSPPGDVTEHRAQLVGEDGRVLASAAVVRLHTHGDCGCGAATGDDPSAPYAFQAYVPNVDRGAAIRIVRDDDTVWERRASERPPRMGRVSAKGDDAGRLRVNWEGDLAGEEREVWLQWSSDGGETWHGLTAGIREQEADIDVSGLPSGSIQVRALLNDGFETAVSKPTTFRIPARRDQVQAAILSPMEGETLVVGRPLRLWANLAGPEAELDENENVRWLLDDQEVGRGLEVWTEMPPPGDHRVTLILRRGTQVEVSFRSVDPERDTEERRRKG